MATMRPATTGIEFVDVTTATPMNLDYRRRAVDLVVAVQRETGFPPMDIRDSDTLRSLTTKRQEKAVSVWIATTTGDDDSEPVVVGHGLIEQVEPHRELYRLAAASQATPPHSIIEVGGLAVSAKFQRSGLARELVQHLVADAKKKAGSDSCVVTVTWPGGISDQWAKRHLHPLGGFVDELGIAVNAWLITRAEGNVTSLPMTS